MRISRIASLVVAAFIPVFVGALLGAPAASAALQAAVGARPAVTPEQCLKGGGEIIFGLEEAASCRGGTYDGQAVFY
ncbi:hypothetical protein [Actinomadura oligospora]|uniref:hypothetical protein n=1 Tax=Actinomadura oligospora TaxID=111804 RepID=UPI0004AE9E86|nr:hypothetical protein [Actinomadura oligospora]